MNDSMINFGEAFPSEETPDTFWTWWEAGMDESNLSGFCTMQDRDAFAAGSDGPFKRVIATGNMRSFRQMAMRDLNKENERHSLDAAAYSASALTAKGPLVAPLELSPALGGIDILDRLQRVVDHDRCGEAGAIIMEAREVISLLRSSQSSLIASMAVLTRVADGE